MPRTPQIPLEHPVLAHMSTTHCLPAPGKSMLREGQGCPVSPSPRPTFSRGCGTS